MLQEGTEDDKYTLWCAHQKKIQFALLGSFTQMIILWGYFLVKIQREKKKKKKLECIWIFISLLSGWVLFPPPPRRMRENVWCSNKEPFFFRIIWHGKILHLVKIMINWGFHCEFPPGCTPKPGLSVRYTRFAEFAPFSPEGPDTVFSHNGELSIKMTGAWKDTRHAALVRWSIIGC